MNQKKYEEIMESYFSGNKTWACTQIRTKKDLANLIIYLLEDDISPGIAINICQSILAR